MKKLIGIILLMATTAVFASTNVRISFNAVNTDQNQPLKIEITKISNPDAYEGPKIIVVSPKTSTKTEVAHFNLGPCDKESVEMRITQPNGKILDSTVDFTLNNSGYISSFKKSMHAHCMPNFDVRKDGGSAFGVFPL